MGDHLLGPVEEGVGLPDGVKPVHGEVAEMEDGFIQNEGMFIPPLLCSLVIGGEVGWDLQPRVEPALLEEHVNHQGLETKTRIIQFNFVASVHVTFNEFPAEKSFFPIFLRPYVRFLVDGIESADGDGEIHGSLVVTLSPG